MICLYNRKKKSIEELEGIVEERKKERKRQEEERRAARGSNFTSNMDTPAQSSPNSQAVSPAGTAQLIPFHKYCTVMQNECSTLTN